MDQRRPLLGVSACLFSGGAILLVRRGRPPFQNRLSLPGGKVEFGETLLQAINREVREETGLAVARFAFVHLHEAIDMAGGVHAVIAVYRGVGDVGARAEAGDDASGLAFHPVAELRAMGEADHLTPGLAVIAEAAFRQHREAGGG